jgi:hypothetical protein
MNTLTTHKAPWSILAAALVLVSLLSLNHTTPAHAAVPGVPTVSGAVNANGTVAWGAGFTISHPGAGHYIVNYPAGTWDVKAHTPVIMPLGATVAGATSHTYGDGSGTTELWISGGVDYSFTFIDAQAQ